MMPPVVSGSARRSPRASIARMRRAGVRLAVEVALAVGCVSACWAGPPTDQLKTQTDRALEALQNPGLRGAEHRSQRQAVVHAAMDAVIDFADMSRRALGAAWADRTPAEREEFVSAFGDFLKNVYVGQIDLYDDEKLLYDGERVADDLATVMTRIAWKDGDHSPVEFRMLRGVDDRWRVYDVSIDGVSVLDNYRAQFRAMLRRNTFEDLVKRIRSQGARQK